MPNAVEAFRTACATRGLTLQGYKSKLLNFSHGVLHRDTLAYAKQRRIPIEVDAAIILGAPMGSNRAKVQQLARDEISRGDRLHEARKHPEMPSIVGDRMLRAADPTLKLSMPGWYAW